MNAKRILAVVGMHRRSLRRIRRPPPLPASPTVIDDFENVSAWSAFLSRA